MESTAAYTHLRNDPGALLSIIDKQSRERERLQAFVTNANRKMFVRKSKRQVPTAEQGELFTFEQGPAKNEPNDESVPSTPVLSLTHHA